MALRSFQTENDQSIYASQDLVDGGCSRGAGANGFDELFLFQRLQNRVERSERYLCRLGQNSGFRRDLIVRIHLCAKRSNHSALARAQFRCWRSWFDTPLCAVSVFRKEVGKGFLKQVLRRRLVLDAEAAKLGPRTLGEVSRNRASYLPDRGGAPARAGLVLSSPVLAWQRCWSGRASCDTEMVAWRGRMAEGGSIEASY